LTFVHLTGRLANLVYSMGVTNTDFYPHQYRPLLTLLESPCRGLLIADEVGLGKTIEAGLIWTEFRARFDKRRLLIVCPAMLREKWQDELLLRFGIKAEILKADELLRRLKDNPAPIGPETAWIVSYQSVRPPRSWSPVGAESDGPVRAASKLATLLSDRAEERALFDMVVFDEAHNMRNRNTGAWKLGELLSDVSDTQVMLSATPINLRSDDLYSLLTLLDPDHFTRQEDLTQIIRANAPLVRARDVVLDPRKTAEDFIATVEAAMCDPVLAASSQLRRMLESPPSEDTIRDPSVRAGLADALEKVNLLSHVLTRTRKRDIQERRIERVVRREAIEMSSAEEEFYAYVTETIRRYAYDRDVNDGFLLATPQRQVSSCPAALLATWRSTKSEADDLNEYGYAREKDGDLEAELRPLRETLRRAIPSRITVEALEAGDTKFARLISVLSELLSENKDEKVVVFTSFRATARYLARRLNESGYRPLIVWGGQGVSKHEVITQFKVDPTIRVLVSTEVAAEGVDLQFCRVVVNYDLPWNPTRIEQRIGRIDRLGQAADRIFAWNLFFSDTIDDRVVNRLLARLSTFESALGEAEAVVGEQIAKLEYELLCRPRSAEEEASLIEQAALSLEQVALQRRALEDNAPHMLAHGQRVLEKIAASKHLMRFITERDLLVFVKDTLNSRYPGHEFVVDSKNPLRVRLSLPADLKVRLERFARERGALTRLATGTTVMVEFRNSIAVSQDGRAEIINQFHPLVLLLANELRANDEHFYPIIAVRIERSTDAPRVRPGDYAFSVAQWSFSGAVQEEWLMPAVVPVGLSDVLDQEQSERLVNLARHHGVDWLGAPAEVDGDAVALAMEAADFSLEGQFQELIEKKNAENEDRVNFQLDSVARHEQRKIPKFIEIELRHRENNREALAKATAKKRETFQEKMDRRRAEINETRVIRSALRTVCGGVIRVL
jgi:SNF2 family DNA or RNA helicase